MYISVDDFSHMYPKRFLSPTSEEGVTLFGHVFPAVISGFHKCIAALARSGNNLIVDHVLQEDGWLKECVEACIGIDVLFVGVKCPLDITEQREKERGDRNIGTARYQFARVHAHHIYDNEVDTSVLNINDCVTNYGIKEPRASQISISRIGNSIGIGRKFTSPNRTVLILSVVNVANVIIFFPSFLLLTNSFKSYQGHRLFLRTYHYVQMEHQLSLIVAPTFLEQTEGR